MTEQRKTSRWFQYRLRTLLVIVMIAGPLLGLLIVPAVQRFIESRRQHAVSAEKGTLVQGKWISRQRLKARLEAASSRVSRPVAMTKEQFDREVRDFMQRIKEFDESESEGGMRRLTGVRAAVAPNENAPRFTP